MSPSLIWNRFQPCLQSSNLEEHHLVSQVLGIQTVCTHTSIEFTIDQSQVEFHLQHREESIVSLHYDDSISRPRNLDGAADFLQFRTTS